MYYILYVGDLRILSILIVDYLKSGEVQGSRIFTIYTNEFLLAANTHENCEPRTQRNAILKRANINFPKCRLCCETMWWNAFDRWY